MNGVMTMAQILDQTRLSSDQREITKTIRQSSEALLTIINDILDFSKIESGMLAIEAVKFDLLEQVRVSRTIGPRAEAASLTLLVQVEDEFRSSHWRSDQVASGKQPDGKCREIHGKGQRKTRSHQQKSDDGGWGFGSVLWLRALA